MRGRRQPHQTTKKREEQRMAGLSRNQSKPGVSKLRRRSGTLGLCYAVWLSALLPGVTPTESTDAASLLSSSEMQSITGGVTLSDHKCVQYDLWGPAPNGDTCVTADIPSDFCASACNHTVWQCCWDPVAQRCHSAEAHQRLCISGVTGWTCMVVIPPPQATCWWTMYGARVGASCAGDCANYGMDACSRKDCRDWP